MAEDYPDYSPPYLVRYGAVKQKNLSKPITPSAYTELCSITGKGIIYGGYIHSSKDTTCIDDEPRIEIDGLLFSELSFSAIDFINLCEPSCYVFYKLKYDDTNFSYVVGIQPMITFEKKLRILYGEAYGHTPSVKGFLNYTLLE